MFPITSVQLRVKSFSMLIFSIFALFKTIDALCVMCSCVCESLFSLSYRWFVQFDLFYFVTRFCTVFFHFAFERLFIYFYHLVLVVVVAVVTVCCFRFFQIQKQSYVCVSGSLLVRIHFAKRFLRFFFHFLFAFRCVLGALCMLFSLSISVC